MLRKFKLAYEVHNFFNKKYLVHNVSLYKKYGINKKYYSSISSEDFVGLSEDLNPYDIGDSRDLLSNDSNFLKLNKKFREPLLKWSKDGYVVLEKFFLEQDVDAINEEIVKLVDSGALKFKYVSKKLMFANRVSILINDYGNGELKNVLEILLNREISLFQTINFLKGSQQRTHSDSIHMSTFPKGNLIAAWVALEDISIDDGPLHFYPGSHKLPYLVNKDFGNTGSKYKLGEFDYSVYEDKIEEVVEKENLIKKEFLAKKGDVLIWHANLLHGGNKVKNIDGSRKSMVFHYLAKGVICYHEVSQRPTLKEKFTK